MLHVLFHLTFPTTLKYRYYDNTEQRRADGIEKVSVLNEVLQGVKDAARIPGTLTPEPVPRIDGWGKGPRWWSHGEDQASA